MTLRAPLLLIALLTFSPTVGHPQTTPTCASANRFVDVKTGNDSGPGTAAQPWRTIQRAADLAVPGDTICVRAGTYREEVQMKNSGTQTARITFVGEDVAKVVVDAGYRFTGPWEQVQNSEIPDANGKIWKRNLGLGNGTPHLATFQGKFINRTSETDLENGSWKEGLSKGPSGVPPGMGWGSPRVRGWYGLAGKLAVPPGQQVVYIRLCGWNESTKSCDPAIDGRSPEGFDISFGTKNRQAFDFNGKSFITVKNFTVTGGYTNILVGRDVEGELTASDNIVEGNRVRGGQKGILLTKGSSRNIIRNNDITLNPWLTLDPRHPYHWFLWDDFKHHGDGDAYGIRLYLAGDDNVISGNVIYHVHDGINVHSSSDKNAVESRRLKVFGNIVGPANDECLGPRGINPGGEWYDNTISNCTSAIRIEARTGANAGPVYIYRNRIVQPEDLPHMSAECFYVNKVYDASIMVYHNSCTGGSGLTYATDGTPASQLKIFNNIFSSAEGFRAYGDAPSGVSRGNNWLAKNPLANEFGGGGVRMWPVGTDPGTLSKPWAPSGSALGNALNLSTNNAVCASACPGTMGYYVAGRYDIGAVQSGTTVQGDTTPPIISNVRVSDIAASSVTVLWDLNEPGTGQVEYGTTTSYGSFSVLEPSFNYTSHSQTISGLQPNTLYNFRVRSQDRAGNLAISPNGQFRTLGGAQPMSPERLRLVP